ncbi:MAG TPA: hypothetical protein VNN22_13115 [Verrucomicrobiae bacterium]|nr:hypothetical protein [Verrucomicrobiae bacterium]
MKSFKPLTLLLAAGCWTSAALAQMQLVTNAEPQRVFGGGTKMISVMFHNPGDKGFADEVRTRLWQTTSATAIQLGETPWKKLQILPQQTVVESVQLDFPAVKAETRFFVQWLENTNHILGKTEVLVYPTNLLAELKPLTDGEPLGVFDPRNQLKPLLKILKVEFSDLEISGLENFSGKLAVIGPFQSKAQVREGLANQVQALAKKGTAVVWLQPPPGKRDKLSPLFYSVMQNTNAVVIVQPELVVDLPGNPQSQLNLIYFCKLALNSQPLTLPDLSPQP